jgi:uncharacterized repeat protein (TIGR01451 family)
VSLSGFARGAGVCVPVIAALSAGAFTGIPVAVAAVPATVAFSHAGSACASQSGTNNLPTGMSQTGIAFDGSRLLVSCWGDTTITSFSPTNPLSATVYTVAGTMLDGSPVKAFGALAYGRGTHTLWACASASNAGSGGPENQMSEVGQISLASGTYTPVFTSHGCDNGLAYDPGTATGRANTLWTSADIATTIYHYAISGRQLESQDVTSLLGDTPANSGIAVGGGQLYLANPQTTTKRVYQVAPDFSTSTQVLSSTHRYEDMECDDQTYGSQTVLWVMWFNQNVLKPLPISGSCSMLTIGQTSNSPVTLGQTLTYTVTVHNGSSAARTNVTVTDTPPSHQSFVSATPSQGSCTGSGPVTCNLGTLNAGATATVSVSVSAIIAGTATNAASVQTDQNWRISSSLDATVNAPPDTTVVNLSDSGFTPTTPASPQGGAVLFQNVGTVAHAVADNTGMGLFDSGSLNPNQTFSYTWYATGSYAAVDATTGHTATVKVPILVPSSGTQNTPFTVTWASQPPAAGFAEDIQVLYPGTTTWVAWINGQTGTGADFTPINGSGTYQFRGRLHNTTNGKASAYSAAMSVTVS